MSARAFLICAAACMAVALARAEAPQEPQTYALVAAMGNLFSSVHEVESTGSHLPPFRKRTYDVKDDVINKLVLKGLGDGVAATQPQAKRIYLSVRLPMEIQERPTRIEEAAFEHVVEQLRGMPQRGEWHRIVVATPAYRAQARDGLGHGMEGLGLFTEPLCKDDVNTDMNSCDTRSRPRTRGALATTPSGEKEAASRYLAPYLFVKVSILDPKTLEVLDTQEIFDHEKIFDPDSGSTDMNQSVDHKFLAAKILERVENSTVEAVRRSELRGHVDVQEKGPVPAAH
jgi:hypothetical protein